MSPARPLPRSLVAAAAAFFALGLSIDPRLAASPGARRPPRARAPIAAEAAPRVAPPIVALDLPAPADLRVEVVAEAGGNEVIARRPGHLVSLRHEGARAAGKDAASLHIGAPPRGARGRAYAPVQMVWETARLDTMAVERGVATITLDGDQARARVAPAAPPEPAGAFTDAHATCVAHRDGASGFTVLCRFGRGARRVGVANVTGVRALDDAWVVAGPSPMVRLDLPLSPGAAEGRVIGFVHGVTGVVIRAEASWPEGEEPTLVFQRTARKQPSPADTTF